MLESVEFPLFCLCFDGSGLNYFGFKKSNGLELFFISFTHMWAFNYLFFMRLICGLFSLSWCEWKFDLSKYFLKKKIRILDILTHMKRGEKVLKKLTVVYIQKIRLLFY